MRQINYHLGVRKEYVNTKAQNKIYVGDYLQSLKVSKHATGTINKYKEQLEIFFSWNRKYNEDKDFTELKSKDFMNYFEHLRNLNLSQNRIKHSKSVLNSFSDCVERIYEDTLPTYKNRVRSIDVGKAERTLEKTIINEDQLKIILEDLKNTKQYQLACFLSLLANSGCRKSEVLQLTTDDFKNVVFDGKFYKTHTLRNKGKSFPRYIIKEGFEEYLNLWLEERKKNILSCKTNSLFLGAEGPALISTINSFTNSLNRKYNLNFYPHCMRHYFVSRLDSLGWSADMIQRLMNWSTPRMVQYYNDNSDEAILNKYLENNKVL